MSKLEVKNNMTPLQFAIILISSILGSQIVPGARKVVEAAGQSAWLSVLIGGILTLASAIIMVRLSQAYPGETFVEYAPKIVGRPLALFLVILFILVLTFQQIYSLRVFLVAIVFYMFDSTPPEALALLFIMTAVYGAAQEWGTIIRVVQFFYVTATTLIWLIWLTSLANFDSANLLPWWPQNFSGVFSGALKTWNIYSGYEIILLLLPLVYTRKTKPELIVAGAFSIITTLYTVGLIIQLGVVTAATIKAISHPTVAALRAVELPGTFVERLENYLLFLWIPTVFSNFTIGLYCIASLCSRVMRFSDHRPFVYYISPFILLGASMLLRVDFIRKFGEFATYMGVFFTFGVVPGLYLINLWRRRKNSV